MWRKIVLGIGIIAILWSVLMPITRTEWINPPNYLEDGSISFPKESKEIEKVDYAATVNRTLVIFIGAAILFIAVQNKNK